MMDDYTFEKIMEEPIRRRKKGYSGFYIWDNDDKEYLEEIIEENQNKIDKKSTVKTRKKVQKKEII